MGRRNRGSRPTRVGDERASGTKRSGWEGSGQASRSSKSRGDGDGGENGERWQDDEDDEDDEAARRNVK